MATLNPNFADIDDEIKSAFDDLASSFDDLPGSLDLDPEPERIENEHVSGFIPYTQGGWTLTVIANLAYGDRYGVAPDCIQKIIDSSYEDFKGRFNKEYAVIYDPDDDEALRERFNDEFHDYLYEGGDFYYVIRAIYYVEPEPRVVFTSAINDDIGYGRDMNKFYKNELSFEHTVDELFYNKDLIKQSFQRLLENLQNA